MSSWSFRAAFSKAKRSRTIADVANFPFSYDRFLWTITNIREQYFVQSFGATKKAAYANKVYECLFVTINMNMLSAILLFVRSYIKLISINIYLF